MMTTRAAIFMVLVGFVAGMAVVWMVFG